MEVSLANHCKVYFYRIFSFYKHVQNIHKFFNQDQIQKAILSFEKKRSKEKENFKWITVDKISSSYKNRIQLIIQCLDFYGVQGVWLREVHEFLKDFFQKRRILETINYEDIPKNHIFSKDKKYILDEKNKNIKFSRFEFDFYIKIGKAISQSTLFVKNSILYTSLEDELLTDWDSCKTQIIKELDNSFLKNTLSDFVNIYAKPIDEKIEKLNKDIQDETNKSIKFKTDKTGQKTWTFPYPTHWSKNKNKYLESIQSFSICHILKIVNEQTEFLKAFTHIKPHYSKSKMDDISVFACLIASATGMGIYKMAQICDLSFQELSTSWKNYIRLSTLRAANDKIANALFMLPIFKNWTLHDTLLFASADGQKINTQKELLMSRYGKKYFGRGKGVVANTLVCNHVPLNMRLIGPHCHESHYLFDLCYNNTTEIDPDVVSTDTEGVNQLNTLLLEVIYKRFAPRYKNFKERIQNLMSFQPHDKFKDCIINPTRTFNLNLVRSEYDNILHIIASLLTGHMNQSYIVKKLRLLCKASG